MHTSGDGERILGEQALNVLAGFDEGPETKGIRVLKHDLCRLRIRVAAAASSSPPPPDLHVIARGANCSVRTVRNYFCRWESMYAFPPPEMAAAIVSLTVGVDHYVDIPAAIEPLFVALDTNPIGRTLLTNLVRFREDHPGLQATDNYFAIEMRDRLAGRDGVLRPLHEFLTANFAEALRIALRAWTRNPAATALDITATLHEYIDDFHIPTTLPDEN
jgi:hypothetical protein